MAAPTRSTHCGSMGTLIRSTTTGGAQSEQAQDSNAAKLTLLVDLSAESWIVCYSLVSSCNNCGINLKDGLWHTVSAEFDGATRKLRIDGTLVASDQPSGGYASSNVNFCVGQTNGAEYFKGSMKGVRIWMIAQSVPPPIAPSPPPPPPPPYTLSVIASGVKCTPLEWQGVYDQDPTTCYSLIKSMPLHCNQEYFCHASATSTADGNCGCVTSLT
eukprot:7377101-Prymnesium_polylepis.3